MRYLLKDRLSAGAFAVLIVWLLVLQSLLGALAQSAMAASAADPLHVICAADGANVLESEGQGDLPQKKAPECPCASLCQLVSGTTTAVLNAGPGMPALFRSDAGKVDTAFFGSQRPFLRGLIGEPRAPPLSL
ncbi:hypothetical protein ATN84_21055 [Paramesorhizobium deserti]|uniref:DUF2946 domain-containing protein n=2 Tax=Paramesorhizobium deserti TaxID=1494590 RepID=A0A135HPP5_9HYPH|nr:hypothetical protein ATN84_21055 [Paramesorhizobium deserti]